MIQHNVTLERDYTLNYFAQKINIVLQYPFRSIFKSTLEPQCVLETLYKYI